MTASLMTARPMRRPASTIARRPARAIALLVTLTTLAGCVAESAKEARCACFKTDGTPTGRCDFVPLPGGGPGGEPPAIFKFLDVDPRSTTPSHTAFLSSHGGPCGG